MNPTWAAENLQTIRTLMERSAIYRRALAPIMILAGTAGIFGGLVGWLARLNTNVAFILLWVAVAIGSLVGALLLVRRQALKAEEPFWSPPTRRVGQAVLPAFAVGVMVAAFVLLLGGESAASSPGLQILVIMFWTWFYGCAVHAAGFFMPRGVRWLGWVFIAFGGVLLLALGTDGSRLTRIPPHLLMAGIFGGLHLVYGIYLYFTEPKNPVA